MGGGVSVGVWGFSNDGTGVNGKSNLGIGGVFESDKGAQINLSPSTLLDKLPVQGQAGDLLVLNGPINPDDPGRLTGAVLYFCLTASDDSGHPAMWGRVRFDIVRD